MFVCDVSVFFFFFNDTATTEIYTLSLHDALPISLGVDAPLALAHPDFAGKAACKLGELGGDRKSTRLNSSHLVISYAVFCLKKKKKNKIHSECFIIHYHLAIQFTTARTQYHLRSM